MIDPSFWDLPYYSDDNIWKLTQACSEPREAIIEGLIYKHTANLFYADDGVGKSLLLFQAICEATHGSMKVYGLFPVPHPVRSLWIQAERHPIEIGERLASFSQRFKPDPSNLIITQRIQDKWILPKLSRFSIWLTIFDQGENNTMAACIKCGGPKTDATRRHCGPCILTFIQHWRSRGIQEHDYKTGLQLRGAYLQ